MNFYSWIEKMKDNPNHPCIKSNKQHEWITPQHLTSRSIITKCAVCGIRKIENESINHQAYYKA